MAYALSSIEPFCHVFVVDLIVQTIIQNGLSKSDKTFESAQKYSYGNS